MPAEKRDAIVAEARQRQAERDAADQSRDALIGQPAPAFPETEWLNSDPLTWQELRGQIVILDFWAEWCGPCRNDLPKMSDLHKEREKSGITVLGIHTPGSRTESIKKMIDLYDLQYPICIDTPPRPNARSFGWLSSQFGVRGIPHAFVVDREGRIAGQGSLIEVLGIASGLPPIEDADR